MSKINENRPAHESETEARDLAGPVTPRLASGKPKNSTCEMRIGLGTRSYRGRIRSAAPRSGRSSRQRKIAQEQESQARVTKSKAAQPAWRGKLEKRARAE
jgi:hypothetical protein